MLIIMNVEVLEDRLGINGFRYPDSFIKAIELNLLDFDLWYIMDEERVLNRLKGITERYPNRNLIPFARRDDNDDIACFEVGKGEKVQVIHDFASEGYEQRKEFSDFWAWLEEAINEMIKFNRE